MTHTVVAVISAVVWSCNGHIVLSSIVPIKDTDLVHGVNRFVLIFPILRPHSSITISSKVNGPFSRRVLIRFSVRFINRRRSSLLPRRLSQTRLFYTKPRRRTKANNRQAHHATGKLNMLLVLLSYEVNVVLLLLLVILVWPCLSNEGLDQQP